MFGQMASGYGMQACLSVAVRQKTLQRLGDSYALNWKRATRQTMTLAPCMLLASGSQTMGPLFTRSLTDASKLPFHSHCHHCPYLFLYSLHELGKSSEPRIRHHRS